MDLFLGMALAGVVVMFGWWMLERMTQDILGARKARRFARDLLKIKAPRWGIAWQVNSAEFGDDFYVGPVNVSARAVLSERGLLLAEFRNWTHVLYDQRKNRVDDVDALIPTLRELKWFPPNMLWKFMCPVFKKAGYEVQRSANDQGELWEMIPTS